MTSRRGLDGVADYFGRVRRQIGARISPSQRVGNRAPPSRQENWKGESTPLFRLLLTTLHFPDVGWCPSLAPAFLPRMPLTWHLPTTTGKVSDILSALLPYGKAYFSDYSSIHFSRSALHSKRPSRPYGKSPTIRRSEKPLFRINRGIHKPPETMEQMAWSTHNVA